MDADALPYITWDRETQAKAVKLILYTAVEGPEAYAEVFASHVNACQALEIPKRAANDPR